MEVYLYTFQQELIETDDKLYPHPLFTYHNHKDQTSFISLYRPQFFHVHVTSTNTRSFQKRHLKGFIQVPPYTTLNYYMDPEIVH